MRRRRARCLRRGCSPSRRSLPPAAGSGCAPRALDNGGWAAHRAPRRRLNASAASTWAAHGRDWPLTLWRYTLASVHADQLEYYARFGVHAVLAPSQQLAIRTPYLRLGILRRVLMAPMLLSWHRMLATSAEAWWGSLVTSSMLRADAAYGWEQQFVLTSVCAEFVHSTAPAIQLFGLDPWQSRLNRHALKNGVAGNGMC